MREPLGCHRGRRLPKSSMNFPLEGEVQVEEHNTVVSAYCVLSLGQPEATRVAGLGEILLVFVTCRLIFTDKTRVWPHSATLLYGSTRKE